MPLYELKIKLTSPMLGGRVTHENIRRFERCPKSDNLLPDAKLWCWALEEAWKSLHRPVEPACVMVPPAIRAPRLDLYRRKHRRMRKRKGTQVLEHVYEEFECINAGVVLTIPIHVSEKNAGKPAKAPSRLDLELGFKYVGLYLGLSPWGREYAFGRFDVVHVLEMSPEDVIQTTVHN